MTWRHLNNLFKAMALACLLILTTTACHSLRSGIRPTIISEGKIHELEHKLNSAGYAVNSFISSGRIIITNTTQRIPATFLSVATRKPFRLKAEITHTWGLPLVHILIRDNQVTVNDLYHKRTYQGNLGIHDTIVEKLPLADPTLLWSLMRAYPEVVGGATLSWSRKQRAFIATITRNIVQEIYFDEGLKFPSAVMYPRLGVELTFSEFDTLQGIPYAAHILLSYPQRSITLQLTIKNIIFNKTVNPNVFVITKNHPLEKPNFPGS